MHLPRKPLYLASASLALAALLSACGGGSASSPAPVAQASLTATAASITLAPSATTTLGNTGGSGSGAVSYSVVTGTCTVSGTTLTAPATGGTCTVTASKAGDASYQSATSSPITVTVLSYQAALTASVSSASINAGATAALSTTGGSGNGAVSYAVTSGTWTVSGSTLTAGSAAGTCAVTATKAADTNYVAMTSAAVSVTVVVPVAATTFVTFDETTAPTMFTFGGLGAIVATDPVMATNKVAKLTKVSANEGWAGATISTCPNPAQSIPTVPVSATNSKMTLRVYAPSGSLFRLKLEDASDSTHSVETEATVTTNNAWETLTFDFSKQAASTAPFNKDYTYNKVSVFPAFFQNVVSANYYVDDLKFLGVNGVSLACPAAPVVPVVANPTDVPVAATKLAASNVVSIYSDVYTQLPGGNYFPNWGDSTVVTTYNVGLDNIAKMATFNYKGIELGSPVDLRTFTKLHVDFWTADLTSVDVYLISTGPPPVEQLVNIPLTANKWTTSDIDLSKYTLPNRGAITQIKFVGYPSGKTLYMDNFYFWK